MKTLKHYKIPFIVASSCLILSLQVSAANGATVSASGQIDWTTLSKSGSANLSAINSLDWRSPYGLSRAGTTQTYETVGSLIYDPTDQTPPEYDYKYDTHYSFIHTSASSSTMGGMGQASATGETDNNPAATISAAGFVSAGPQEAFSAEGKGQRGQAYRVDQQGYVAFTIEYELSGIMVDAMENYYQEMGGDELGWGYVRAWSRLRKLDWNAGAWMPLSPEVIDIEDQYSQDIYNSSYIFGPETGQLSFSYFAREGDYLLFEAGVDVQVAAQNNAVPLPPAVWLFGAGIIGLASARRKMQQ